jgi:type II secretory pathway component PulF
MPNYTCRVVTEQGNIVERVISAGSVTEVTEIVSKNEEQLLSAKKQGLNLNLDDLLGRFKKIPPEQMKLFTNQLRTMMSSGVPLLAALDVLERQAATPKLKTVVTDLHKRVSSGDSLSKAMSHHGDVFNTLYVAMVKAGESSGVMGQVLEQLEMFNDIDIKTKKSVKKAIRYPIMVMSVMVIAGAFAVVKIVPTFATMLTGNGH